MVIPIYQVDAFTSQVFSGNPAAVCPLEAWLDDSLMQSIAAENNLAETAFFVPQGEDFALRWFTPTVEVPLCGHATLASSFVLYTQLGYKGDAITFHTKSGPLTVTRQNSRLTMNFPSMPPEECTVHPNLLAGLGATPRRILASSFYLAVYDSEDEIRNLQPDFALLNDMDHLGVCVTAPGGDCDFVSRFFAPAAGISEDPVTGAAHCILTPYWAKTLGRSELVGHQISKRGGRVHCRDCGDRVEIAGEAALYMKGAILL